MSFKKKKTPGKSPENPVDLLKLLTRRTIPDAMSHQKDILRDYAIDAASSTDAALQLPTGSGKTLVGLLIAEWRRRKFGETIVYLCPTRQLVHQVVEEAEYKYGIDAVGFTGSKHLFQPRDCAAYQQGQNVAITTYSALFNSHPFFESPDCILLDDAHAAENYIAKMWTLAIPRFDESFKTLHAALADIFRDHISGQAYQRLAGSFEDFSDAGWVDKLKSSTLNRLESRIVDAVDAHVDASDQIKFTWPLLREHLDACHIYLSPAEIMIRPIIPPTWSHPPFANAKHRVYMSATLGAGGDLERLTGRPRIKRVEAPADFRSVGVGRRFFIFPSMSLTEQDSNNVRVKMQEIAGRSVVLTPDSATSQAIGNVLGENTQLDIFYSGDIEQSKSSFLKSDNAVAILAGRFDGMDFPEEACRLLCLNGLPKAANSQERFFVSRMGASALLNERIRTRVLQAAGRCTRALQDRSAVVVTGTELVNYFTDKRNRSYFHPELQAEIEFGVDQSMEVESSSIVENFRHFLANDAEWEEANTDIVDSIEAFDEKPFPGVDDLASSAKYEIEYQKAMWSKNYEKALEHARSVTEQLNARDLFGYRALWFYLSGATADKLASLHDGDTRYGKLSREFFEYAQRAAPAATWFTSLVRVEGSTDVQQDRFPENVLSQVERLETQLLELGTRDNKKFEKRARSILSGLDNESLFEEAQKDLGELLGFIVGNGGSDAAPDPWWLSSHSGIVFEDHANGNEQTVFGATKAKQASGHPEWLQEYCPDADGLDITPVLVTPCRKATSGAKPQLRKLRYWHLDDFVAWARAAVDVVRRLKSSLPREGDLFWRQDAAQILTTSRLTVDTILADLPWAVSAMEIEQ